MRCRAVRRAGIAARWWCGRTTGARALAEFRGARLAVNGFDSQSGWGSILHHVAPLAGGGSFFAAVEVSGAHVGSVERVAAGEADIAAIDLVTWGYCLRHRAAAARLRVLMLTDPTPGLPYIAAPGADVALLRAALAGAVDDLAPEDRAALGPVGFVPMEAGDYAVVADRLAVAAPLAVALQLGSRQLRVAAASARKTAATASAPASGEPLRSLPPR